MKTISNVKEAGAAESQSFGSFAVNLEDDESVVLAMPVDYGHVLVAEASVTTHGMAWVRGTTAVKYFGGTNFDVIVNTVLSGTTGTDGKLTVSANSNNFYLENRTGAAVNVSITFLGISSLRM